MDLAIFAEWVSKSHQFPEISSGPKRYVIRLCQADDESSVKYLPEPAGFQYALCG